MIKILQVIEGYGAEGAGLSTLLGESAKIDITVEVIFQKINEMMMHGYIIQQNEKYIISPN